MATQFNYLSLEFTIGSYQLFLETKEIPTKDQVATAASDLGDSLKDLIMHQSFKMKNNKMITVSLADFLTTVSNKLGATALSALNDFFDEVAGATTGISVDLWDLCITTFVIPIGTSIDGTATTEEKGKFTLAFKVRVNLDSTFYTSVGVPTTINSLISVDSLGMGVAYESDAFAL